MHKQHDHKTSPAAPTLKEAFWYWLKLGLISFGGPAGQIAIMHQDLVENKRWISDKRFLHALNYCMLLPGPEAQQLATYIGWLMHRTWGGLIAGGLFVLPSLLILIILSWVYMRFGTQPTVVAILYGIKPAVVAIVLFAAHRIGKKTLKNFTLYSIALIAMLSISLISVPFPVVILSAALLGVLLRHYFPTLLQASASHQTSTKNYGKAIIHDDTPTPTHAKFSVKNMLRWLAAGSLVWGLAFSLLLLLFGWQAVYTQMAWFFTKAALLTFGGAYAVLPYVYQGAVEHYQWLSAQQMIDGLALGETTPGPLIMILAFVGFVGGWTQEALGAGNLVLSGVTAACIVTFFTFFPSFLFIFIGAPLIESTKNNLKLDAPLTTITAAVVGVILSLALFFAQHVFISDKTTYSLDWVAIIMTIFSLLALVKWQLSIIKVISICALFGLIRFWLI